MGIKAGSKISVYYNLNKHCWSVVDRKTGRVAAYYDQITVADVKFSVGLKGRERARKQAKRNVHAKAHGIATSGKTKIIKGSQVSYNPFNDLPFFYLKKTNKRIDQADLVLFDKDGCAYLVE